MNINTQNNCMISIVVPIYNTPYELLRKCVESILRQTYKNIELLLINDGSTKDVAENCDNIAELDKRIKVYHQSNQGVSVARNIGIENSTGEYIMFVDSDDTIEARMCSEMLTLSQKENADVVMSGYFRDYSNGKSETIIWDKNVGVFRTENERRFLISNMFQPEKGLAYCCVKLYRKSLLVINNLRLNLKLSMGEDAEFSYRVLKCANTVCYLPQPLYHYFFNVNSAVRAFKESIADDYIKSVQILGEDLLESYKDDKRIYQAYYNWALYHLLLTMINYSFHPQKSGKLGEKLRDFKKLCHHPVYKRALQHVDYNCFSITRAVPLFFIVHKWYVLAYTVAVVRHWQFRRRNNV